MSRYRKSVYEASCVEHSACPSAHVLVAWKVESPALRHFIKKALG